MQAEVEGVKLWLSPMRLPLCWEGLCPALRAGDNAVVTLTSALSSFLPEAQSTQDAGRHPRANSNIFPLMLLACSVDTPILINRSHLLALHCASHPTSCVDWASATGHHWQYSSKRCAGVNSGFWSKLNSNRTLKKMAFL